MMLILADLQQILNYVNWNYLFLFLLLGTLIGGIWALFRGIYRTTCKYIVEGILIVILVLCMPGIVNQLTSLDFSQWFNYSIQIQLAQGELVSVQFTSVDKTIVDIINALGLIESTSNPALYQTAIGLVHSALGLVLLIVGMILVVIITPVLTWLIYLLTFVVFVSKDRRKNKKHRLLSGLEGAICGTLIAAMFISPLSSMLSLASQAADEINKSTTQDGTSTIENKDFQAILNLLASYNDSAYYSTISFGNSDPSSVLDNKLMTQVTETTINGVNTSIYDELGSLINLLTSLSDAFTFSDETGNLTVSIDYDKLVLPEAISSALDSITTWKTIMYIVPALAEIGFNILDGQTSTDMLDSVDLSNVNWNDTISNIKEIYYQLYQTGLIDSYLVPMLEGDKNSSFKIDFTKRENYKKAVLLVVNSDLIKNNLPNILANAARSMNVDYISSLSYKYANLNYDNLFSNIIDFIFYSLEFLDIDTLSNDVSWSSIIDTIFERLSNPDNTNNVKALICGGQLILNNSQTGEVDTCNYDGLLSIDLFSKEKGIVDVSQMLVDVAAQIEGINEYISDDDLVYIGNFISDSDKLKDEIGYVIDVSSSILRLNDLIEQNGNKIDFSNQEVIDCMNELLDQAQKTQLISKIMPNVIENLLSNQSELNQTLFGLKISDLDFEPVDSSNNPIFITEMKKIIEILPDIDEVSKLVNDSDSSTSELLKKLDLVKLENILNVILENKILNPVKNLSGGNGEVYQVNNYNFNTLLKGIFNSSNFSNSGFYLPEDLSNITWLGENGEVKNLIRVLEFAKENSYLFENKNLTINDIPAGAISTLFSLVNSSSLLKSSLPSILQTNLSSSLSVLGVSVNFYAITNWEKEGQAFEEVIANLKNLPSTDFSKIDWFSLDANQVNNLLVSLAKMELFGIQKDNSGRTIDKFGNLVYYILSKSNDIKEILGDGFSIDNFSRVDQNGQIKSGFENWYGQLVDGEYSLVDEDGEITIINSQIDSNGEISKIANLFDLVKQTRINESDFDYSKDLTPAIFDEMLTCINSSKALNTCLASIINYASEKVGSIYIGTIDNEDQYMDFDSLDSSLLYQMTQQEREKEIDCLVEIYEFIYNRQVETFKNILRSDGTIGVSQAQIGIIENLLNSLVNLKMANSIKQGYSISLFDDCISKLLNLSSIDQIITNASDAKTAKIMMLPYINQISRNTSLEFTWKFSCSSQDVDDSATSERYNYVISNKTSQILAITKLIRYARANNLKIDFTSNLSDINSITGDNLHFILTSFNESYLFHSGVSRLFKVMFENLSFDKYLVDGYGNQLVLDFNTHTKFDANLVDSNQIEGENIEYWQRNIDSLVDLYSSLIDLIEEGELNLDNIQIGIGEGKIASYDIISPLSKMPLFNQKREYLIYNLLINNQSVDFNIQSYIRPYPNIVSDDEAVIFEMKVARIRNLLFKDGIDDSEVKIQCNILDNMVTYADKLTNVSFEGDSILNIDNQEVNLSDYIYDIIMSSFSYQVSNNQLVSYQRGYLSQEILSNIIVDTLSKILPDNLELQSLFFKQEGSVFDVDYRYLNPIEANGIKGLIKLSSFDSEYFADSNNKANNYKEFADAISLLGRNIEKEDKFVYPGTSNDDIVFLEYFENDLTLKKYFAKNQPSQRLVNSRLAIILFENYASKVILGEYQGQQINLSQAIDVINSLSSSKIDFENTPFEDSADAIVQFIISINS